MKKPLAQIIETEKLYWNESRLQRAKIKPLRRHAFHYSYKKEDKLVEQFIKVAEGKNVLELGSNTWSEWIDQKVRPKKLTCINISEKALQSGIDSAKKVDFDIDFKIMDANILEFPDNSFDVVFGRAILHHLDIDEALMNLNRVLKPGGTILFLEPLNINPFYKLYRVFNPEERTPDEHALVFKDFSKIKKYFKHKLYPLDFISVLTGSISLLIFGDKKHSNLLNKIGFTIDNMLSKLPFLYFLFARVIIHCNKKES